MEMNKATGITEVETMKEKINVNKIVCEKREMINLQGDMIVPDSKPDIINTINTSGNVSIYKKEIIDGKVRIDGNVLTHIMYLADVEANPNDINLTYTANVRNFENIRGLNTGLDFSETINIPEICVGMKVDVVPTIKFIDCKVLNGRKISINVNIEIEIKAYSKEEIEIVNGLQNTEIQVLEKKMKINSLVGEGTTKAFIKENIMIPSEDNLAEILYIKIELVDKDIKTSYNKVLAKSDVEIKMAYLTEDGRIEKSQNRVALVGFIDMPNIKEENLCETSYMTKNIIIKPNSTEEHSVYVEIEVEISCMVYEEKEICIIQDMYCPRKKMKFDQRKVNTIINKNCQKTPCNIRENLNIPEVARGTIIDVGTNTVINRQNKTNGKIVYEGEVGLNFIYIDNSTNRIDTKNVNIPFEQTVGNIPENCQIDTKIEINSQEFSAQADIVNANVELNIETNTHRNQSIPVISNISTENEENLEDYSVIIYVVRTGDTLWKIAKKFGSTVDDIVRVNGIENPDKINPSEKIYIPQYVLNRAKAQIDISAKA